MAPMFGHRASAPGRGAKAWRVTGLALIGLAGACWSGSPLLGMLIYSATVMLYLAFVGIVGGFSGILLWPAVVVHAILTALLARDQREANLAKT